VELFQSRSKIFGQEQEKNLPSALALGLPTESYLLSKKTEVWVVGEKSEHDEIGVETVEAVSGVRVAVRKGKPG